MATESVPTTETVRSCYKGDTPVARVVRGRKFDFWLAEVKAAAWDGGYNARVAQVDSEQRYDTPNPYSGHVTVPET